MEAVVGTGIHISLVWYVRGRQCSIKGWPT